MNYLETLKTFAHSMVGLYAFYWVCMAVLAINQPENKKRKRDMYGDEQ